MTKQEILEVIKLLSAFESWSFSANHTAPDYLLERLGMVMEVLEREILK